MQELMPPMMQLLFYKKATQTYKLNTTQTMKTKRRVSDMQSCLHQIFSCTKQLSRIKKEVYQGNPYQFQIPVNSCCLSPFHGSFLHIAMHQYPLYLYQIQ